MSPIQDNTTLQIEEIEVLCSIFLDKVTVHSGTQLQVRIEPEADLRVTFPPTYPSETLPVFELSAPFLSKKRKDQLTRQLEDLGRHYQGLPVVFTWVEAIQERLFQWNGPKSDGKGRNSVGSKVGNKPERALCPTITSGTTVEDRKSVFQAHFAVVESVDQVEVVLGKLKTNRKIANAKHNMFAYRLQAHDGTLLQDYDNDGENQGGSRLLHLLEAAGAVNVVVVVTRWFGGIQIGPDRFKHINTVARAILEVEGIIGKCAVGKAKRKKGKS